MNKVQLTLTDQEAIILEQYGKQFGYNLSRTIRFLISKAVEQVMPEFVVDQKIENKAIKALEAHQQKKTIKIDNLEKYFENL